MHLFPDLFEGVGTICDAIVHLDVRPEATPIVCSPRRVPDALRKSTRHQTGYMPWYW